jgi:septal ring factor EnvC (AmiA/AmiB activator)
MENVNVDTWVWIVAAVVLAGIIIAVVSALGSNRKKDWDRSRAESIRRDVAEKQPELRQREASTLEAEAEAQRARADAARLEAEARDQRRDVDEERSDLNDKLREADERDPDIDTDADTSPRHADSPRTRDY